MFVMVYDFCLLFCFARPVALYVPASPVPPTCVFTQWAFLLSSSHVWWTTPALLLPLINPIYLPSLDFSSMPEYPACAVIPRVFFLLFPSLSWPVLIVSFLYFCSGYVVCLSQPLLCLTLGSSPWLSLLSFRFFFWLYFAYFYRYFHRLFPLNLFSVKTGFV